MTNPLNRSRKCSDCGVQIRRATCLDGWCAKCIHSQTDPATVQLFCLGHRTHVEYDDHCKDWEADC